MIIELWKWQSQAWKKEAGDANHLFLWHCVTKQQLTYNYLPFASLYLPRLSWCPACHRSKTVFYKAWSVLARTYGTHVCPTFTLVSAWSLFGSHVLPMGLMAGQFGNCWVFTTFTGDATVQLVPAHLPPLASSRIPTLIHTIQPKRFSWLTYKIAVFVCINSNRY